MATLLRAAYASTQTTYDLWRLRRMGLIERIAGTHTYVLTSEGARAALFYTVTFMRLVHPLFAAAEPDDGPRPDPEIRRALRTIDQAIARQAQEARVAA